MVTEYDKHNSQDFNQFFSTIKTGVPGTDCELCTKGKVCCLRLPC